MYYVQKTLEISSAHRLDLDYESKCTHLHGHNWKITVYCKARELDKNGMVVDFAMIKRRIKKVLDH
jgi:6-pyruvoyltetrahydropterin/6-carboxytetrahydropterin synthase